MADDSRLRTGSNANTRLNAYEVASKRPPRHESNCGNNQHNNNNSERHAMPPTRSNGPPPKKTPPVIANAKLSGPVVLPSLKKESMKISTAAPIAPYVPFTPSSEATGQWHAEQFATLPLNANAPPPTRFNNAKGHGNKPAVVLNAKSWELAAKKQQPTHSNADPLATPPPFARRTHAAASAVAASCYDARNFSSANNLLQEIADGKLDWSLTLQTPVRPPPALEVCRPPAGFAATSHIQQQRFQRPSHAFQHSNAAPQVPPPQGRLQRASRFEQSAQTAAHGPFDATSLPVDKRTMNQQR